MKQEKGESRSGEEEDHLCRFLFSLPWFSLLTSPLLHAPEGAASEPWLGGSLLAFLLLDQGWARGPSLMGVESQFSPQGVFSPDCRGA